MSEQGKGSNQRPVDKDKFDSEYERIFGKKEQKKEYPTKEQISEYVNRMMESYRKNVWYSNPRQG